MQRLEHSVIVDASPETAFAVVRDVNRLTEWMGSLIEVRNVKGEGVGQSFEWTYRMAGVSLDGFTSIVEEQAGRLLKTKSEGGVHSDWTFRFEPHEARTKLTITIEYRIPIPVLGRLAEQFAKRRNEREAETNIEHLKDIIEHERGVI